MKEDAVYIHTVRSGAKTTQPGPGRADESIEDEPRQHWASANSFEQEARLKWYLSALNTFIELHSSMKQHGPEWYASMALTCGGSESASVMDINPYMTFRDVVESKLRRLDGDFSWDGGEACFWGTLWEDINAACVAVDLGCEVVGDAICIMHSPGIRYSPDGYTVMKLYRDEKGKMQIWTTDMDGNIPVILVPVLLELKCPLTRKPKSTVPMYYRPQVQSGLVASPIALLGLYVEAVIRKCAVSDMGPTPTYDTAYHKFDGAAESKIVEYGEVEYNDGSETPRGNMGFPLAWGLVYIYAPRVTAPRGVRLGWKGEAWAKGDPTSDGPNADASHVAQAIYRRYYGVGPSAGFEQEAVDLGEMDAKTFVQTLEMIDQKLFKISKGPPCFADGRGVSLRTGNEARRAIAEAAKNAPEHYWLMGILPWKLFTLNYHCAMREAGFAEKIQPLIDEVHETVAEARASPNRKAYLHAKVISRHIRLHGAAPVEREQVGSKTTEQELQDLFDSC